MLELWLLAAEPCGAALVSSILLLSALPPAHLANAGPGNAELHGAKPAFTTCAAWSSLSWSFDTQQGCMLT